MLSGFVGFGPGCDLLSQDKALGDMEVLGPTVWPHVVCFPSPVFALVHEALHTWVKFWAPCPFQSTH